jgi:uncharacterized RmlC-like cupin family protein
MNTEKMTVVRSTGGQDTGRGFIRRNDMSHHNAPSEAVSMTIGDFPVRVEIKPHYHPYDEMVYIMSGVNHVFYGPDLEEMVEVYEGDILLIPAGVVHQPTNPGPDVARYLVARPAPEEAVCWPEHSVAPIAQEKSQAEK